ncbi:MAG: ATP-binding protein [Candidatus Izemoplasmataceae bacterium]
MANQPDIDTLLKQTAALLSKRKDPFYVTGMFLRYAASAMNFRQLMIHDTSSELPVIIMKYPELPNQKPPAINHCISPDLSPYLEKRAGQDVCYYFPLRDFGVLETHSDMALSERHIEDFINIIGMVNNHVDLLRYKENQTTYTGRLEKTNNLLKTLIDSMPDLIAYKNTKERYVLINKAAKAYYESRVGDIEGLTIDQIYDEKDAKIVRQLDNEVIRHKKTIRKTIMMATDQGYKTVDSIRSPVLNNKDELEGIITISRDLEDIQKTKKTLEAKERFQNLLMRISINYINVDTSKLDSAINEALELVGSFIEADRAYVFRYDFDSRLIHNTHEWVKHGVSPQIHNLQNQPLDDFFNEWVIKHLKGQSIFYQDIEKDLDHDSEIFKILSMQNIKSLITVPLMAQGKCIGFAGFDDVRHARHWKKQDRDLLNVLAEIITNILLRKTKEDSLQAIRETAVEANRQKTNYLSSLSHEIRTPLHSLSNALDLMDYEAFDKDGKKNMSIARTALSMVNSLVGNALERSKIEAGILDFNREEVELDTLLFDMLRSQNLFAIEKDNRLEFDYDESIDSKVLIDASRLRQVLLNLLNNALKFTQSGSITLGVQKIDETDTSYDLVFSVSDNGMGMDASTLETLSDKYRSIANEKPSQYEGFGLGMPIVYEIIELMGSTLKVESTLNAGSRFEFSLTLEKGKTLDKPVSNIFQNKKILILFDSVDILKQAELRMRDLKCHESSELFKFKRNLAKDYAVIVLALDLNSRTETKTLKEIIEAYRVNGTRILLFKQNSIHVDLDANIASMIDAHVESFIPTRHFEKELQKLWHNQKRLTAVKKPLHGKVLLIEDNPMNRETMVELLKRFGLIVDQAKDGMDAIGKIRETSYHLIIVDYQMPRMNGLDFARKIKLDDGVQAPIILLSAHPFKEDLANEDESSIRTVLIKPISSNRLYDILSKELSNDEVFNHYVASLIDKKKTFNEHTFRKRFEAFDAVGKKAMDIYKSKWEEYLGEVKIVVESENLQSIAETMHYLKGAFEYLSAERLAFLCEHLIKTTKETNRLPFEKDRIIDLFKTEFVNFNDSIEAVLNT